MPDYLIFLSMVALFALLAMVLKIPIGLSLALSAVAGSILGGHGIALRHLIEGSFGYFDTILIIFCAMIFMKVLESSGILDGITSVLLTTFHRNKAGLLLTLMFLLMFPGMITGSSTAAVLSTGAIVAPVLLKLGMTRVRAAAMIAMGAILGMIAPPVNILVMIMGGGVDMPYIGLTLPLLLLTVPLAVMFSLLLGIRHIHTVDANELNALLPVSFTTIQKFGMAVPPLLVLGWLLGQAVFPHVIPDIGIPAVFLLGSVSGLICGNKINIFKVTQDAVRESIPILTILAGVGMFIQIMTLTGGRGWTVISFLSLPPVLLYLGIAVSMPLFGAVSAYGSASILGVPFILALISKNAVITASALSAIAGLGDLMPPTALAGMFAAQVVHEPNYFKVLKLCLLPAFLLLAAGISMLLLAGPLDKWI